MEGHPAGEIVLVRHGETAWSRTGQHTGRTDLQLTAAGRRQGVLAGERLRGRDFVLVLTSPLARAHETCRLAGLAERAQRRPDLMEWDYGEYDGRTTADVQKERPGWNLWTDGVPGGETIAQVGERADRIVAELRAARGDVAVFAHGHILRVLAARWLGLPPSGGRLFALGTAAISVLGYEHGRPVICRWNDASHLQGGG